MTTKGTIVISVASLIDNFTYRVEQACPLAGLTICSVANVRFMMGSALQAICGYVPRNHYFRGVAYDFLTQHRASTHIADQLLTYLIDELDQLIYSTLRDRPFHLHWYVQMGQGRDVTTLYIERLGDEQPEQYLAGSD